jgi:hypothetical protein
MSSKAPPCLRLAEVEPRDYVYVITPTGELPEMIAHWLKAASRRASDTYTKPPGSYSSPNHAQLVYG